MASCGGNEDDYWENSSSCVSTSGSGDSSNPDPVESYTVTFGLEGYIYGADGIDTTQTYKNEHATLPVAEQSYVYGAELVLPTPTVDTENADYEFAGWAISGTTTIVSSETYTWKEDLSLVAVWAPIGAIDGYYHVIFMQEGCDDILVKVLPGESVSASDIPQVQEKTGHTVAWESRDLTNVRSHIIVNAVATPNEYTITYNLIGYVYEGGGINIQKSYENKYATLANTEQTVTYGQTLTLAKPTVDIKNSDYDFDCWVITGTDEKYNAETYMVADDLSLTAVWVYAYSGWY